MKKRFTEQQIVGILREPDAGATDGEIGRRHGVHPNTIGGEPSTAAWRRATSSGSGNSRTRWCTLRCTLRGRHQLTTVDAGENYKLKEKAREMDGNLRRRTSVDRARTKLTL